MKNSENRNFEQEWSQAFEGAEVAPSTNVWASIDSQLSQAESGNMRKRVVFYQRLAASAIFFALCLGAAGIWYLAGENEIKQLTKTPDRSNESVKSVVDSKNLSANNGTNDKVSSNSAKNLNSTNQNSSGIAKGTNTSLLMDGSNQQLAMNSGDGTASLSELESATPVSQEMKPEPKWYDVTLAKETDFLATLKVKGKPIEQIASAKKFKEVPKENNGDSEAKEDWWASVNGSGGVYSQTTTSNSVVTTAFMTSSNANLKAIPVSTAANAGASYSYGVTVGKKVAKRLVLMTGISYLNQSLDYNSNVIVLDASNRSKAYLTDIASEATNLATTTPYTIKNTNEFISFPLQAGYMILDRKAGIQLNAGVAADLFYRNTIADQSGRISSYSQSAGDNSVYRTVNWTGLIGTELSYKVNNHYHISLVPGVRYSFDSVLKSSTGSAINPLIWDVGFRFKYIF